MRNRELCFHSIEITDRSSTDSPLCGICSRWCSPSTNHQFVIDMKITQIPQFIPGFITIAFSSCSPEHMYHITAYVGCRISIALTTVQCPSKVTPKPMATLPAMELHEFISADLLMAATVSSLCSYLKLKKKRERYYIVQRRGGTDL